MAICKTTTVKIEGKLISFPCEVVVQLVYSQDKI